MHFMQTSLRRRMWSDGATVRVFRDSDREEAKAAAARKPSHTMRLNLSLTLCSDFPARFGKGAAQPANEYRQHQEAATIQR
jgi:hypothetical protein